MTIAEQVRSVMLATDTKYIWFGANDILDSCAVQLNMCHLHPMKRTQRILNALEYSPEFKKSYMKIEHNGRLRRVRCFFLQK